MRALRTANIQTLLEDGRPRHGWMRGNRMVHDGLRFEGTTLFNMASVGSFINGYMPFLVVGFAACQQEKGSPISINDRNTLTFRTGFAVRAYQCGTLSTTSPPERTFYFANTATQRRLKRFDHTGMLLQDVDLSHALAAIGPASGVQMMEPERIIVFNDHCTRYAIVDGAGTVLRTVDLAEELVDTLGFRYELGVAGSGANEGCASIALRAYCRENVREEHVYGSVADEILGFYSNEGRAAHMAMLKDPLGEPAIRFGMYAYYRTLHAPFDNVIRHWGESPHFRAQGNKVLVYSYYSPLIHQLDEELRTVDSLMVTSDEGAVFIQLPPLGSMELRHMQDSANVRMMHRSVISDVVQLMGRDQTLVCVKHANDAVKGNGTNKAFTWTYKLYDKGGTLLAEVPFLEPTHEPYFVIQHGARAWIKRASTLKEARDGTIHFDELIIQ